MLSPARFFLTIQGLMRLVLACACVCAVIAATKDLNWSRRSGCGPTCPSHIRQVGLALLQYQNRHGCFPPAYVSDAQGKPLYSWRVLVLPYLDANDLYNAFNFSQPWDGPDNLWISQTSIRPTWCPDADRPSPIHSWTNYVAITGPGTAFPGPGKTTTAANLKDGAASTILVAEIAGTSFSWAAPGDLDVRTMSFQVNDTAKPSLSSAHTRGTNAVMMDGSIRWLSQSLQPQTIKALISIRGGETIPSSEFAR